MAGGQYKGRYNELSKLSKARWCNGFIIFHFFCMCNVSSWQPKWENQAMTCLLRHAGQKRGLYFTAGWESDRLTKGLRCTLLPFLILDVMHPNHSKYKLCLSKWRRGGGFVRLWDALPCLRCHTVSESWLHDFRHGFTGSHLTCWAIRIIESCLNRLAQGKCRARCGDRSQQHGLWWWDCKAMENFSKRVACQVM